MTPVPHRGSDTLGQGADVLAIVTNVGAVLPDVGAVPADGRLQDGVAASAVAIDVVDLRLQSQLHELEASAQVRLLVSATGMSARRSRSGPRSQQEA
jgi:hypothetical protein